MIPREQPLMVTEAQQTMIDETRLQAELHREQLTQTQKMQNEAFAQFAGATMQQQNQGQPHVTYNVFNGGGPNPPAPPSVPVSIPVKIPVDEIEKRIREEYDQQLSVRLAAEQKSLHQKFLETQSEVMRAREMAAASAARASTDEIRENRNTQVFRQQLGAELGCVKEAARNQNALFLAKKGARSTGAKCS